MAGKITTNDIKTVGKVAGLSGFFCPTDAQKKIKVTFWRRWNAGPVRGDDEITAAAVAQITDSSVIEQWWKDDKFRGWFKNQDTFAEDADYNANLAVETLRQLMYADNPSVRLKAATESLKLKQDIDRRAEETAAGELDPEQMQKLFLKALKAGLIKLPEGDS